MRIHTKRAEIDDVSGDALVVICFESATNRILKKLRAALGKTFEDVIKSKEFSGKFGQLALLHSEGKLKVRRVVLVGIGKEGEFYPDRIRQVAAKASVYARELGAKDLVLCMHCLEAAGVAKKDMAQALVEGALLGLYRFDKYRSEDEKGSKIEGLTLIHDGESAAVEGGASTGRITAEAVIFTRDLANLPSNVATPREIAKVAVELARRHKLRVKMMGRDEIKKTGMNGLLAVSQGSVQPPVFIILEYNAGKKPTIVLVGKGITFDSGGISIKPGKDMEKMKYDKAGACSVLGIMKAAAELRLPMNIVGLVPLTENMPSGSAYKPGDILRTYSKKTVEIINTDAEGRMVLADALAYASKYKPAAIIDMATLTGACTVVLGDLASGLLGNNQKLVNKLKKAGEKTWERVWELPLWKEYDDYNKSDVADIKNIGGGKGEAGTITAAAFLKAFVGETPWAHLDIASTAWVEREKPYAFKGATGVGVRLVTQLLMDWEDDG